MLRRDSAVDAYDEPLLDEVKNEDVEETETKVYWRRFYILLLSGLLTSLQAYRNFVNVCYIKQMRQKTCYSKTC